VNIATLNQISSPNITASRNLGKQPTISKARHC